MNSTTENIDELLDRVKDACAEYGNADGKPTFSDVARDCRVSRKRVSEWMARKTYPGGESALRLLAWVQIQEARQRRAANTKQIFPTSGKTRLTSPEDGTKKETPKQGSAGRASKQHRPH